MPGPTNAIKVDDAKLHCRVDHNDDNTLFQDLIDTAFAHLFGETGILCMTAPGDGETIPAPLRQAMLLYIERLYDADPKKREALERSFKSLTDPYRTRFIG